MPRLLVKVKKTNWLKNKRLEEGDVPGDCLQDLRIKENELSVWHIEAGDSNLKRVMTALAGNQESIATFDFLLFDEAVITTLGLKIKVTAGKTPDREANRWHRDLIELTGKKALALVLAIFDNAEFVRFWEREVEEALKEAISLGHIDRAGLNPRLASKLVPEPATSPKTKTSATPATTPKTNISSAPVTATKAKVKGKSLPRRTRFMKMCREITSFSASAWRRFRNG